jgi:Ras-related C3 botulinum toxin substrate 1
LFFKIGNIGKTSILNSFIGNQFNGDHLPTIIDTYSATLYIDKTPVCISIMDTAGQEDYDKTRMLNAYALDLNVIVICFSIVHPTSYDNCHLKWIKEANAICPNVPVILVGTKLDLKENEEILNKLSEKGNFPITYLQGVSLSQKINATKYIECSSVTKEGVDCIFSEITKLARLQSKLTKKKPEKHTCHLL